MSAQHRSLRVTVDLLGFWLAGTAGGDAATVDISANRDEAGLSFLPGRSLKGLLRHAAADLAGLGHASDEGAVSRLFGHGDGAAGSDAVDLGRYGTIPGALHVSSARLPEAWQRWATTAEGREAVGHLFGTLSSTALDRGGKARKATLRTVEVAVPMTLVASIDGLLSDDDLVLLRRAAGLVRGVGRSRTRGLGRARITIEEGSS